MPRPFGPCNDSIFFHSAPILVRKVVFMSLRGAAKGGDAAICNPCIRRMLSPRWGDNFLLQQPDKLKFEALQK